MDLPEAKPSPCTVGHALRAREAATVGADAPTGSPEDILNAVLLLASRGASRGRLLRIHHPESHASEEEGGSREVEGGGVWR